MVRCVILVVSVLVAGQAIPQTTSHNSMVLVQHSVNRASSSSLALDGMLPLRTPVERPVVPLTSVQHGSLVVSNAVAGAIQRQDELVGPDGKRLLSLLPTAIDKRIDVIDKPESIEAYLGRLNILADEKTIETFTHMNAGAIENGTIASGSHISTFVPSWTAFSPPDVSGSKFPVDLGLLAQQSVQPQVLKAASLNREAINLAAGDFQQFGDFMRHREASSGIELAGQLIQTAAPKMNSSELALADFYLSVANDTNLKVLQSARAGTIPSSLIDTLEAYFKSTEMMGRRLQMGLPALDSRLVEVAVSPKASVAPDRSLRFRVYALPRGIFANDRISDEQRINLLFELSFQKLATFEEPTSRLLPTEVPMMIWIGPDFHHGEMAHLIANRLLKKVSAVSGQLASNEKQHIRLVWPDDLVEP